MAEWTNRTFESCGNILRWRADVVEYKCSNCGCYTMWWFGQDKAKYCSHCGEKMTNSENYLSDFERR